MKLRRLEQNSLCGDGKVELYESMSGKTWVLLVSYHDTVDSLAIFVDRKNARSQYDALAEGGPT